VRIVEEGTEFMLGGFGITPFALPHDSLENMGYCIRRGDTTFTIMTDVGMPTEAVRENIARSNYLVLEANYDVEMLEKGSYPYILKQRIAGPFGHLSNDESAKFVAEIYRPEMKNIMLCHLSENNNSPERALQCLYQQFRKKHVHPDVNTTIFPLPRHKSTGFVYL
jgi:phosphoribosyl 1,2-cyclic phosphodiesterase